MRYKRKFSPIAGLISKENQKMLWGKVMNLELEEIRHLVALDANGSDYPGQGKRIS
jgi:hypothetical protein